MDFQIYLDDYLLTFLPWCITAPHQQFSKLFPKDRVVCVHISLLPPYCLRGTFNWAKHGRVQVIHCCILIYSRRNVSCLTIFFFFNLPLLESWGCREWSGAGGTCPHLLSPLYSAPACSSFSSKILLEGAPRGAGQWWSCLGFIPFSFGLWNKTGRVKWIHYFSLLFGKERELSFLGESKMTVCTAVVKSL